MNKKGFEIKSAMFAIIVVGVVLFAATTMVTVWDDKYGSGLTPDLDEFDKSSGIINKTEQYRTDISPQNQDPDEDPESGTFRSVFGIVTGLFNPFSAITGSSSLLTSLESRYGIDPVYITAIVAMIVLAIVFLIVAIVFRISRGSI